MEIVLNTNELGYLPFLDTNVNSFIIGLKHFCINQRYALNIREIMLASDLIQKKQKKIYLSLNIFAGEKDIYRLKRKMKKIKELPVNGFIISDLGILNIFKENNLTHKVILDCQTYVTNKYSAKSLINLGIDKVYLSKEIILNDIKEITSFNKNKIALFAQGYYPISYSKRPILTNYYKKFNIKRKKELHYLKEENREQYYLINEMKNNLVVYNHREYSLFSCLKDIIDIGINYIEINALFLKENEIKEYLSFYKEGVNYILENKLDEYAKLNEMFKEKYIFETPFLYNQSFLLKEDK